MTYEEYLQAAKRQPLPITQESIFLLQEYRVDDPSDVSQQSTYNYDLTEGGITFCQSLDDAELAMRQMVEKRKPREEDDDPVAVCFLIREIPYGIMIYPRNVWDCLSVRIYNAEGAFVDQNMCAGFCYEGDVPKYALYYGRSQELMRFKPGDIVQVTRGVIRLGVVVATPLTPDECWRIRQNSINTMKKKFFHGEEPTDEDVDSMFGLDVSDDSYVIVDGPGYEYHSHIPSVQLLEPTFPIPDELRRKLMRDYEITMKELNNG